MIQTIDNYLARTVRVWGGIYAIVVAIIIVASLYTLFVSFWRGPFRDMWEAIPFIEKAFAGQATFHDYWEQYGFSHRPMVSRWLWVADYRWFAGSNHLLLAVSLLMQFAIAAGVWRVMSRETVDYWPKCILLSGVGLCLLTVTQVFNLLHTFDVQWFLTAAAVVWSTERLVSGRSTHQHRYLVAAWLCVLFASWNNFSGLVIWPVQILFLHAMGYTIRQQVCYCIATALYLLVYFYGLPTGSNQLLQAIIDSGSVLQWSNAAAMIIIVFPVWYLSNPFSFQFAAEGPLGISWPLTWLAPVIAGCVVLFVMRIALGRLSGRHPLTATGWMGLHLAIYGFGVAVVTSLGRGYFWENVYALRYQNIVLLFWIGIILLLVSASRFRFVALFLGVCLLAVMIGVHQGWYHNHTIKMGNRTRDAHLALAVGLEKHLSAFQATTSRSHLYDGTTYTLEQEVDFLRRINAGPLVDPDWQVPTFASLQGVPDCEETVLSVDVRGSEDAYARLTLDFSRPVHYRVLAWFDTDRSTPGLLIGSRSDTFFNRLLQSWYGFSHYAGFGKSLPQLKAESVYAAEGNRWCRLRVP